MRPDRIVVPAPLLDHDLGLGQGVEDFAVEQLVPELAVDGSADRRFMGYPPVTANTAGSATATAFGNFASARGSSTTTYSGGTPLYSNRYNQALVVRMFNACTLTPFCGAVLHCVLL